ncbi:MAG: tetratricopeptide repeat protein [Muribaculaceae bacterium]|nr:tetratricopeptide repeat protein [Muribaculaceae bacterium]
MASSNQTPEQPDQLENINNRLTNLGRNIETNKKAMGIAMGAILVVACLTFAWLYLYKIPTNNKAMEAYNKVELSSMMNDSLSAAQYKKVADEYSSTAAGKLAALSAAETLYNSGKYDEAAKYLKKFSSSDKVLDANAQILLGDCYVNLKKYDDAIAAFKTAEKKGKGNPQIAPRALLKQAVVYDEQKKFNDALNCYETIKKDYPEFSLGNGISIDSYIEREKARL